MDHVARGLSELSTPTISDALDRLGIAGQAEGIYPVDRGFRLAGRAYTVLYQPIDVEGGTVGDFIDDVPPGEVVVLDNSGRLDATVWGDIMTLVARRRRLGGTVINGVCRDSDRALRAAYPLFSRKTWMRTGKGRVKVAGQQVPVVLGGVRVRPGDVLIGDSDGVVVVPAEREAEVLAVAGEIEAAEAAIRQEVERGTPLRVARQRLGYHHLQTPADRHSAMHERG
jgi:regulator of RNase E activity RraA